MVFQLLYQCLHRFLTNSLDILAFLLHYQLSFWQYDKANSTKTIPGPRALPIIGTRWCFYFGSFRMCKIHEFYKAMHKKYGPIFKEEVFMNVPVYNVFEKNDIEKVLKACGKFPIRPPSEAELIYRYSRPDRYASAGMVNEQGSKWHHLRTTLTSGLTSPKTISDFQAEVYNLSEDWCNYLKSKKNSDGLIADIDSLVVHLGIETACDLVLGRRLGYLFPKTVSEKTLKLADALENHFIGLRDTQFSLPFWKYFPSKSYKTLVESENYIYETVLEMIKDFGLENHEGTIYNSIMNSEIDEREKTAAIIDFISAGIHTFKNSLIFLLYIVAKHPNVQNAIMKDLNYAKACMLECFRLLPTATPLARITEKDLELSGYPLKAGNVVLCHSSVACRKDENFPNANEFRPERWLGEERQKTIGPSTYLVTPFGIGQRTCPGKRFTELILPIFLQETVKNFDISTNYELELQFEFLMAPKGPVSMTFKDRR